MRSLKASQIDEAGLVWFGLASRQDRYFSTLYLLSPPLSHTVLARSGSVRSLSFLRSPAGGSSRRCSRLNFRAVVHLRTVLVP